MIDIHAHFAEEGYSFPEEWDKIRAAGVERVVLAGDTAAHSKMHRDFCAAHPGAYFCAGIHPSEADGSPKERELAEIEELLSDGKCVAVGEIPTQTSGRSASYSSRNYSLPNGFLCPFRFILATALRTC